MPLLQVHFAYQLHFQGPPGQKFRIFIHGGSGMPVYIFPHGNRFINHIQIPFLCTVMKNVSIVIIGKPAGLMGKGFRQRPPWRNSAIWPQFLKVLIRTMIPDTVGMQFNLHLFSPTVCSGKPMKQLFHVFLLGNNNFQRHFRMRSRISRQHIHQVFFGCHVIGNDHLFVTAQFFHQHG